MGIFPLFPSQCTGVGNENCPEVKSVFGDQKFWQGRSVGNVWLRFIGGNIELLPGLYDRMQFYAEINQASRTVVVVVLHHTLSFVIF